MTRQEVVKYIKDEITISGAININVSDAEINRIIDRDIRIIRQINPMSVGKSFTVISNRVWYQPEFRRNRIIQFPECVRGIFDFYELNRRSYSLWGINNSPDFSFNRLFLSDIWMGGTMNAEVLTQRVVGYSFWDQMKQFIVRDIQFSWNEPLHQLLVTGRDVKQNVFCGVYVDNPEEVLFNDGYVLQYLSGSCYLRVAPLIGTFQTNLLGNVTVNTQYYTETGNKYIDDAKEYWKNLRDADLKFKTGS